jgi:hypothetical protein
VTFAKRLSAALAVSLAAACGSDDAGDSGPPLDAAAPSDAFLSDAAVVDCDGDHRESRDRTNDPLTVEGGEAEATGFILRGSSDPFEVCGQIDPAQASDTVADGDYYEFTIGGDAPLEVRLELRAPDGQTASDLEIDLHQVDEGTPVFVARGPFRASGRYGLIAGIPLQPGTYWVNAVAFNPPPEAPVLYAISIQRDAMACPRQEPSYMEQSDGTGRGNDMVAIDHPDPPELTSASDMPESTGLELAELSGSVAVQGASVLPVEPGGDSYLDRDSYLIRTGPETNELEVRLNWPNGDVDLDAYLFAAGDPSTDYSVGLGATVGEVDDERFTVSVDPDRNYWLWVGAYQDGTGLPISYSATLCPRTNAD